MDHSRTLTQTLGLSGDGAPVSVSAEVISAFRQVCDTQLRTLYSYVRYRVPSSDAAEELTGNVFLKSLERLETFDPAKGELTAWIFGIARNVVRDYLRARRRWTWVPIDWILQRESPEPNPESALGAAEVYRHLAHALTALPDRERDILGLKFGAGLTNREIARITGLTETHVGVIVFRAVGRLRRQFAVKGVRRG